MLRKKSALSVLLIWIMLLQTAQAAPTRAYRLDEVTTATIWGASRVQPAGDVNGDGIPDILLSRGGLRGQPRTDNSGRAYVVFGREEMQDVDVTEPLFDGFAIYGAKPGDYAAVAAPAGDVNGDGLADIIIGAPDAPPGGAAYVVFGKKDTLPIHLALFDANLQGTLGFRIVGAGGKAGRDVAGGGDMNGDGYDDLLVAAPFRGVTYVIFGKPDPLPVPLHALHPGGLAGVGYPIFTPQPDQDYDYGVAGPGDMNGDGIPDIAIGVFREFMATDEELMRELGYTGKCCYAYVVFGKPTTEPVIAEELGRKGDTRGFRLVNGGPPVSPAGDLNGDGLKDLSIGSRVIFGKRSSSPINLRNPLGRRGFRFIHRESTSGASGGHDIDGDGLDDLLIGSFWTDFTYPDAGAVYGLIGKRDQRDLKADRLGSNGFRIDGYIENGGAGKAALLGDLDGDGLADLAIGVGGSKSVPARTHVVFGAAVTRNR